MQNIKDFLTQPFVILLGYVIGFMGLLATIYGIHRSKKFKQFQMIARNFVMITDYETTVPNLEILYKGEKLKELKIAKVGLWNRGNETITKADIAANDPVRVELQEEGSILRTDILESSRPATGVKIEQHDERSCNILFDFLDSGDGSVIQVAYTGSGIRMAGTIKGQRQDTAVWTRISKWTYNHTPILAKFWLLFLVSPIVAIALLTRIFGINESYIIKLLAGLDGGLTIILLFFILACIYAQTALIKAPKCIKKEFSS